MGKMKEKGMVEQQKSDTCTCLPNSKNSMCLVHSIRDNKYRYKNNMQVLMMAIAELPTIMWSFSTRSSYELSRTEELFDELSWRGRRVSKASKFWPDKEIERRDNE